MTVRRNAYVRLVEETDKTEERKERQLTPKEASQRLRKGSRTVALICPQADTIRFIAAPMTGDVEIKCSASVESVPVPGDWVWIEGGEGESNEGKSSAPTGEGKVRREALGVGVLGEGGGEVHGVGVWKCVVGVWRALRGVEVEGDVGGVVYPEVVVVVGGGVDGGAASSKTRSMSSSASPTMVCNARSTSNVVILVSLVPVAMKNNCKIKPGLVIFQVDLFQIPIQIFDVIQAQALQTQIRSHPRQAQQPSIPPRSKHKSPASRT
jgi:hypothetical protein